MFCITFMESILYITNIIQDSFHKAIVKFHYINSVPYIMHVLKDSAHNTCILTIPDWTELPKSVTSKSSQRGSPAKQTGPICQVRFVKIPLYLVNLLHLRQTYFGNHASLLQGDPQNRPNLPGQPGPWQATMAGGCPTSRRSTSSAWRLPWIIVVYPAHCSLCSYFFCFYHRFGDWSLSCSL